MFQEEKGEEKVEARGKEGEKKQEGGEKKAEGGGGGEKKEEKEDEGKEWEKKKGSGGEGDGGDKKETPPPPPPEEIVMRVYMHCEGCARKVKRSLKGFKGPPPSTLLSLPSALLFSLSLSLFALKIWFLLSVQRVPTWAPRRCGGGDDGLPDAQGGGEGKGGRGGSA